MTATNDNAPTPPNHPVVPELHLSEGFRALVVRTMHATVEIHEDGRVVAHTNAAIERRQLRWPPQPVQLVEAEPPDNPGKIMLDGTVYCGMSPDTGRPMFTTSHDSYLCDTWQAAHVYAAQLNINGRQDWRVPSKTELAVLFESAAAIRFIDTSGSYPQSWYWTSTENPDNTEDAWLQEFGKGWQMPYSKTTHASLRCVRG